MLKTKFFVQVLVVLLIEFAGLFVFYYFLIGKKIPSPFNIILCFLAAAFMLVSIASFVVARHTEEEMELMGETRGTPRFQDGEKVAVFGPIFPVNDQLLTSPFTQNKCVAYAYDIFHWEEAASTGAQQEKRSDYRGFVLTPSYVKTPYGEIRLLGFPVLKGFEKRTYSYTSQTHHLYENASFYIRSREFEDLSAFSIGKAVEEAQEAILVSDGSVQQEYKFTPEDFDLKTRELEEQYVGHQELVGLIGSWSKAFQGIRSDINEGVVTLWKGTPGTALRSARTVLVNKVLEGIVVFCVVNLIIGLVWAIFA